MHDGPQHERRAHGRDAKVGLLPFDEVKGLALGEGFGSAVAVGSILKRLLVGDGVPVGFAVGMSGSGALETIDYACKR